MAAFAVVGAVYFPATAAVSGAVRGMMPFVAAKADDQAGLVLVLRDGTWLALLTGVAGAVVVAATPMIAIAGGVPGDVVMELRALPFLLAASVLVVAIGAMATSVLVGLGRGGSVMRAGLAGAGTTVVLAPLLVLGPGPLPALGLNGIGITMLVAGVVSGTGYVVELSRRLNVRLGSIAGGLRLAEVVKLARVGVPMAGTVLVKFAALGVLAFAATRVGAQQGAAHSVAIALVNLTFTAAVAIGQAVVPLVARHAASRDLREVRASVVSGLQVGVGVLVVVATLLIAFRGIVVPAFTTDQHVAERVLALLPLVFVVVVTDGVQAIAGFGLVGLKRTTPSLVVFLVCYGLLALISVPLAGAEGLVGLWVAMALANVLLIIGQLAAFLRQSAKTCAEEADVHG